MLQGHYVLRWTPSRIPSGLTPGEMEQSREFQHPGSAISWARRKIRRGEVLFDRVEMIIVTPFHHDSCFDITEDGVKKWEETTAPHRSFATTEGVTEKRLPRNHLDGW